MPAAKIPVGTILIRAVEVALGAWILKDAAVRFLDTGNGNAAVGSIIFVALLVSAVETSMWLFPRLVSWTRKKWHVSTDEALFRIVQAFVVGAMVADAASRLFIGKGFGIHQPGCLLSVVRGDYPPLYTARSATTGNGPGADRYTKQGKGLYASTR